MLVHRLAIVGGGDVQIPFKHRDTLLVAFNGEIYNWRKLREQLGGVFFTDCDTEVLAEAWYRWGPGALEKIDGQYAFAIADASDGSLTIARDRAGEKSLYWGMSDDHEALLVASEIKALECHYEEDYCRELDLYEFDCRTTTPFTGIYSLPPAHSMRLETPSVFYLEDQEPRRESGYPNVAIMPYWKVPGPGTVDTRRDLLPLIHQSVQERIPRDIPWTILVSGGIDSAILQRVAKAPVVYTVAFPEYPDFDDTPAAQIAANGAELRVVSFTKEEALEALPKIVWHLDTPATWTAVAQWFLAKRMKEDGYKVVFSGEGADEVFGGYTRNLLLRRIEDLFKDPVLGSSYRPLSEHVIGDASQILARMHCRSDHPDDVERVKKDLASFLEECHGDMTEASRRFEWHFTMQVLLRQTDRMFMAHGLELRCPFLAREIVEYGFGSGRSVVNFDGFTKPELRSIANRLFIPKSISHNRVKRGFAVPWNLWHQGDGTLQGSRGQWGREHFAQTMLKTWRKMFFQQPQ